MGARLRKVDMNYCYWDIKIGSKIDDKEALKKGEKVFISQFGLAFRIKKVKEHVVGFTIRR